MAPQMPSARDEQKPEQPTHPPPQTSGLNPLIRIAPAGFAIGLIDIHSRALSITSTEDEDPQSILTTFLPFLLGSILTATLLSTTPVPLHPKYTRQYPLAIQIVRTAFCVWLGLLLFLPPSGWLWALSQSVPGMAMMAFLSGFSNAYLLAVESVRCEGSPGKLGLLYGGVALYAVAAAGLDTGLGERECLPWWWKVMGLIAAAGHVLYLFWGSWMSEETDKRKGGEGKSLEKARAVQLPHDDSIPPPASRAIVLGGLFAFTYHAVVVAIPSSLNVSSPPDTTDRFSLAFLGESVAIALVIGRFVILLGDEEVRQPWEYVLVMLTAQTATLMLPGWVFANAVGKWNVPIAIICAERLLGPAYPWAMSVLLRRMEEREKLSGMAIIIAFANAGAVAGLFVIKLNVSFGAPGVLRFVVAVLSFTMYRCWETLGEAEQNATQASSIEKQGI
ncbi:hypothetical protein VTI74DRAFT_4488 [Chaetomium olivicolor]